METWFLVNRGIIKRVIMPLEGKSRLVWPVAASFDEAKKLIEYLGIWNSGARPAKIGSVMGETLQNHIQLAMEEGCEMAIKVNSWNEDGSPNWGGLPFTKD